MNGENKVKTPRTEAAQRDYNPGGFQEYNNVVYKRDMEKLELELVETNSALESAKRDVERLDWGQKHLHDFYIILFLIDQPNGNLRESIDCAIKEKSAI